MPSLLASVSSNPVIREYAQGFAQQMTQPVADFLAPTVEVTTLVGRYKKYNEADRFKVVNSLRAIGGPAAQVGFSASDATYNCTPRALDFPMDYLEIEEESALEDLFKEASQILAEQATLGHEGNVINAATNLLLPSAIPLTWDGATPSDPVNDIDTQILNVIKAARYGSLMGTGVLFGTTAWKLFKNNTNVKNKFVVGTGGRGSVGLAVPTEDVAGQLFVGNPQVKTSYMVLDTAAEGLPANIQFILDTAVIVFARSPSPTRRDPSFMKTFRKMGQWMVPGSYVREDGRGRNGKDGLERRHPGHQRASGRDDDHQLILILRIRRNGCADLNQLLMAWNALQESDVLTVLAGPELSAYRTAALAAGQPDPVAEQITNVTNMVRGYIAAWLANTLGPEGTIPDKLLQSAVDILAVKIPMRAAGKNPTESRERAQAEAMKILRDVSIGRFKIEVPDSFTTEQIAVVAPTIACGPRRIGRGRGLGRFEEGA